MARTNRGWVLGGAAFAWMIAAAAACGGDDNGGPSGPTVDGGPDASGAVDAARDAAHDAPADHTIVDAGRDVAPPAELDAGTDAADAALPIDAGADAPADAGVDAEVDAGIDAEVDAGADAEVDAGVDAEVDAGADAEVDAGVDAEVDAGVDAEVDAGVDAGTGGADAADAAVEDGAAADAAPDAGCTATMALFGGTSQGVFGATWSAGVWTVQTIASGSVAAPPSLIPYPGGWLAVATANANVLVSSRYDTSWSTPSQIASDLARGAPALAPFGADAHAVYRGTNDSYYHATYSAGAWDNGSDPVGGASSQDFGRDAPTMAAAGNELDVAFAGDDSNLYVRTWSGGAWRGAAQVTLGVIKTITPRIVALTGGAADLLVVWASANDAGTPVLEYATRDAGTKQWSSAAAVFDQNTYSPNPVSIASRALGGALLAFQGGDGKAYVESFDGSRWTAPSPLLGANNPILASTPAVATGICGDDAEVAYVVTDGTVHVARVAGATVTDASPTGALVAAYAGIATAP